MSLPSWLKVKSISLHQTKTFLRKHSLHSVCEEARCPNKPYCFSKPTAAFMILGSSCTRRCAFCAVSNDNPKPPDKEEPIRLAQAVKEMMLKYVVITSVTRDDLEDGGATHFSDCIRAVRGLTDAKVEVLTPDFKGSIDSLKIVLDASPSVFNHNLETIKRLYPSVRPQADYERSLMVLEKAKEINPNIPTKSGFMLGLGEGLDEVDTLLRDLRSVECDIITIGQYMRPSKKNIPVKEYVHPHVFEMLRQKAINMGFKFVASAPLVRSSMNAEEIIQ